MAQSDARGRTAQADQAHETQILQIANATPLESGSGTCLENRPEPRKLPSREVPSKPTAGRDGAVPTQGLTCSVSRELAQRQAQTEAFGLRCQRVPSCLPYHRFFLVADS